MRRTPPRNEIGEPGEGNTIENNKFGIYMLKSNGNVVSDNAIEGNTITNNVDDGVDLLNGASSNAVGLSGGGNVISGNGRYGVYLDGAGTGQNRVAANLIGTNAAGTAADANMVGVEIAGGASDNVIGGAGAGAGNVISGNTDDGVLLTATARRSISCWAI